ncbi:nucleoside transmembrane transporter FUN26 [Aspergillus candidus]|uniref:Nucleoside transporter-domain-containing protein n=1 Tax=Aspergillus candidus TaxID=41067 RepID=A0A2I2FC22_ASPCN|nr:hypothetical protein BDW47DRAFT_125603 [Aspergillus candidus]PLB38168.1 hypothetical protein BDW47DRAFT_125603 [Aspergillus candidus]
MNLLNRWSDPPPAYEPVDHDEDPSILRRKPRFSRFEYGVFLILGVSMLWAWNMFLAASPYFHHRFEADAWAATNYQPSILAVSTITNLGSSYTLARLQRGASYPRRIVVSLLINVVVFTMLAVSTVVARDADVRFYFAFLMTMVCGASLATGINQNGVFAYVAGFGREEYTQAIMGGQGVAGVLPCIVQIVSVLAVPRTTNQTGDPTEQDSEPVPPPPENSSAASKSAFWYFLTATAVSSLALVSFLSLVRRRRLHHHTTPSPQTIPNYTDLPSETDTTTPETETQIPLTTLFTKLRLLSTSIFLCFAVTMIFPVYTSRILPVTTTLRPEIFIPLAFLFWNAGDLTGRMLVLLPSLSTLAHRPRALFTLALARILFLPLYLLCNVDGQGAVLNSDAFYLVIVQLLFGATNGFLSSSCMMGAGVWVDEREREAAGGFMSLMLVGGLAAGSLASFLVA